MYFCKNLSHCLNQPLKRWMVKFRSAKKQRKSTIRFSWTSTCLLWIHPKQQLKWFQQRAVYNFHMLSMRYVIEEIKRLNKEFTICFLDFQLRWWNPFSSVKWTLWDALCYLWLIICSLIFVFFFAVFKRTDWCFRSNGTKPGFKSESGPQIC